MKNISIIGSTGSIGTQALDVIKNNEEFKVVALSANKNIDLLEKQIREFEPRVAGLMDEKLSEELKKRVSDTDVKIVSGMKGLIEMASLKEANTVLTSVVGMIGLRPTMAAIKAGKDIALANKETLVTAGELVMNAAKENNINIIPVDSEHSAIFQALNGEKKEEISKLILTASGGPFRGKTLDYMEKVTVKEALKHPNWSMGRKISIDSATMMNKGLEVIEAKWLFDVNPEEIEVIVHPQSIVHSMVEFVDGSIIAHLGVSDMRIPIQYALTYPNRKVCNVDKLSFSKVSKLEFEEPDLKNFPCLKLAIEAMEAGGTMPVVLNAANEVAVELFLSEKIKFTEISQIVEKMMKSHKVIKNPKLDDIIEVDNQVRDQVYSMIK